MLKNQICYFKYGILEIKLKDDYIENPPDWIKNLMESNLIIEKNNFSKFAILFIHFIIINVNSYWMDDDNFSLRNMINNNDYQKNSNNNNTNCFKRKERYSKSS